MNTEEYLERFKAVPPLQIDLSSLSRLQYLHITHIPFENLDVIHQIPITLNIENLYCKVVKQQRGGFCYELNGLFQQLLDQLGFNSYLIAGTVYAGDGKWAKEESHAAIIVELDKPYLVDVGFGDSFRQPIPLSGEIATDISGSYRIIEESQGVYLLQRKRGGEEWQIQHRFTCSPRSLTSFNDACRYNETSPDSPFTKEILVTIATEKGRDTLSGDTLTITNGQNKMKKHISKDQLEQVLKKHFKIDAKSVYHNKTLCFDK
ncbi:N-hydroxyarylamine O-acetyltransferase [Scopulibacillus daqui]|uniref:N-hydroxyarylamine O-acetyltransferase n=1 Tax=Scopulibacillus daqui TaxID=1469162 RepID=A0ABS2Q2Y7_9BACL|nr:arylamine N-acetyltransferase [Scopulibacillus daqui]MBM7646659.1 N-hydroxyarylamine O-acetyltransferase [Scopulibacillus daqui]